MFSFCTCATTHTSLLIYVLYYGIVCQTSLSILSSGRNCRPELNNALFNGPITIGSGCAAHERVCSVFLRSFALCALAHRDVVQCGFIRGQVYYQHYTYKLPFSNGRKLGVLKVYSWEIQIVGFYLQDVVEPAVWF